MSFPFENHPGARDDALSRSLDRLVDGELGAADRADLLALLERTPGGWRRCALAFLEAQAWGEALTPAAEPPRAAVPMPPRRRAAVRGRLAIAAGLIAAFGLGWAANGRTGAARVPGPAALRPRPAAEPRPAVPEPRDERFSADVERLLVRRATPPPAIDAGADPQDPGLPEALVKQWAARGYEVDQRRRVVPVRLEDGRRVPLPVDEVRVQYIGDRVY